MSRLLIAKQSKTVTMLYKHGEHLQPTNIASKMGELAVPPL